MDSRIALSSNTQLRFQNKEGGAVLYTIVKEIGRGGSCIVYDASYETNSGDTKRVRIKECYPYKLQIDRNMSNHLVPLSADFEAFEKEKRSFRTNFSLGNGLFYAEGLFDALTNTIDIYDANGTTYLVSTYSPECTLATYKPSDIKVCITLAKQVAHILKRIHNEGFIYLDIKPENILVSDSYTTRVQLFDFDSLIPAATIQSSNTTEICNTRLSYSKGFAAIELQTAKFKKLGPHTDVYGVGALLFYLLFGVTPTAADCEPNATFDYEKLIYPSEHQDKLYFALTDFFHNTLANFYLDRFHDMQQVIDYLSDIERLADSTIAYIRSTKVAAPPLLVGRNEEIQKIHQWYKGSDNPCLFVVGMGGIGKSTIIRSFLSHYRQDFDNLLYLPFHNTIPQTLSDDYNACISTITKDSSETFEDYYRRKLAAFRSIVVGTKSLLVIDNYTGMIDNDLLDVLSVGWKVVLVSRCTPQTSECEILPVLAIDDHPTLYCLFEQNLSRNLTEDEKPFVDNIIQKTAGHTLVLDLIAKQLSASYMSISAASALVDQHGFSNIAPEKISIQKDAVISHQTISSFITALFESDSLPGCKQSILKVFSLLDTNGIDINLFHNLIEITVKDATNELITNGWLRIDGKIVSIHPVIKETVHCWKWTDDSIATALNFLSRLTKQLKAVGHCGNCPPLFEETSYLDTKTTQRKPFVEKWVERVSKLCSDTTAECAQAYSSSTKWQNPQEAYLFLKIAEGIIDSCRREPFINCTKEYANLLYYTVINMPRYREEFILDNALALVKLGDNANGIALMNLYRCILSAYQERKAFNDASSALRNAKAVACKHNDNYVYALYYDIVSEFYDHVLNGAYDAIAPDEKALFRKMQDAIDKVVRYSEKAHNEECLNLQAKNLLAKATLTIRNTPKRRKEINRTLDKAKNLVEKHTSPYDDIRSIYYMVCAWYNTLVIPSFKSTIEVMERAQEITKKTAATSLDFIDNWVIPSADILCHWSEYASAIDLLATASEMCERKKDVIPYLRKNLELKKCQLDVYCEWEKFDTARDLLKKLDSLNSQYSAIGVTVMIPNELRDYLA